MACTEYIGLGTPLVKFLSAIVALVPLHLNTSGVGIAAPTMFQCTPNELVLYIVHTQQKRFVN